MAYKRGRRRVVGLGLALAGFAIVPVPAAWDVDSPGSGEAFHVSDSIEASGSAGSEDLDEILLARQIGVGDYEQEGSPLYDDDISVVGGVWGGTFFHPTGGNWPEDTYRIEVYWLNPFTGEPQPTFGEDFIIFDLDPPEE